MDYSLKVRIYFCLFITILLIVFEYILYFSSPFSELILFNKYYSCLCFFWCIVSALICRKKIIHPYVLFIISFGLFLQGRIFLDVLNVDDVDFSAKTWSGLVGHFSNDVQHRMLCIVSISLLFFNLGALFAFDRNIHKVGKLYFELSHILFVRKIGYYLFVLFFIPFTIYLYFMFVYVLDNGYLALFLQEDDIITNPILKLSDDMCLIGVSLYLSTYPNGKRYICVLLLFFLTVIAQLGGGSRGLSFSLILTIVSYLGFRYDLKFKRLLYVVAFFILLINVSKFVVDNRNSGFNNVENIEFGEFDELLKDFVYSQGISLEVIGFGLERQEYVRNSHLYLLGPFLYNLRTSYFIRNTNWGLKPKLQDAKLANESYLLGNKLSYILNSRAFLNGRGIGSVCLVEWYWFGEIFGVICISFLFSYLLCYLVEKSQYSYTACYFMLGILPYVFYLPRDYTFHSVTYFVRYFFVLFLVQMFVKFRFIKN